SPLCMTRRMPSSTPSAIPRDGSSGDEAIYHTSTCPSVSLNRQMSVKVPPESTPTRQRAVAPASIAFLYDRNQILRRMDKQAITRRNLVRNDRRRPRLLAH